MGCVCIYGMSVYARVCLCVYTMCMCGCVYVFVCMCMSSCTGNFLITNSNCFYREAIFVCVSV